MKLTTFCLGLLLALGVYVASPRAEAVALTLDGSWTVANERSNGEGGFTFGAAWTFESESTVELCLVDVYVPGDIFRVYNKGLLLGEVGSFDPLYPGDWAGSAEEALELGTFSSGCWVLEPGSHSITIETILRPGIYSNDPTSIAFSALERSIPSVPEGGSGVWLLGASMVGIMGWRWKQRPR